MKEKRDETIILRLSKTEKNRIYEKMLSMGIRSLSAYIRKMALDGYCLNLDLPQLRRMSYLLQNCSNNLNQVAKRANECGKVYAADMEDLRQRLDELIDIGRRRRPCRTRWHAWRTGSDCYYTSARDMPCVAVLSSRGTGNSRPVPSCGYRHSGFGCPC